MDVKQIFKRYNHYKEYINKFELSEESITSSPKQVIVQSSHVENDSMDKLIIRREEERKHLSEARDYVERVDFALSMLSIHNPQCTLILRYHYNEDIHNDDIMSKLELSYATYYREKKKAKKLFLEFYEFVLTNNINI